MTARADSAPLGGTRGASVAAIYAAAFATIVMWSGSPIAGKAAVLEMSPYLAGALRTIGAALLMAPLILALKLPRPGFLDPARRVETGWLLLCSFCCFAFWPLAMPLGLLYTSATHGALILATLPITTGLVAAIVERAPPSRLWIFGCLIAFAGEAWLLFGGGGTEDDGAGLLGDAILFASCFVVSLGYVAGSKAAKTLTSWSTTAWGVSLAGVAMLPVAAVLGPGTDWSAFGAMTWGSVAYMAVFSSVLGYVCWYWALDRGGAARIGTMQFLQPVGTVILAVLILDESLRPDTIGAALVILTGVALAQKR